MSCKIVPSALPHSENKSLEMKFFFFLKKVTKGKKIKNNFRKTYKDWDYFLLAVLVFRVPEHVDLKQK